MHPSIFLCMKRLNKKGNLKKRKWMSSILAVSSAGGFHSWPLWCSKLWFSMHPSIFLCMKRLNKKGNLKKRKWMSSILAVSSAGGFHSWPLWCSKLWFSMHPSIFLCMKRLNKKGNLKKRKWMSSILAVSSIRGFHSWPLKRGSIWLPTGYQNKPPQLSMTWIISVTKICWSHQMAKNPTPFLGWGSLFSESKLQRIFRWSASQGRCTVNPPRG